MFEFKGEESKVIILSLVRNRPKGNIGFVAVRNRINVLLSRAKHGMYILGNAESLKASNSKMWHHVLSILEEENAIGPAIQVIKPSIIHLHAVPFFTAHCHNSVDSAIYLYHLWKILYSRSVENLTIFFRLNLLINRSTCKDFFSPERGCQTHVLTFRCPGMTSQLTCQKHPGTSTMVSKPEDFTRVQDGGCEKNCTFRLACGHSCPRFDATWGTPLHCKHDSSVFLSQVYCLCLGLQWHSIFFGIIHAEGRARFLMVFSIFRMCHSDDPQHNLVQCQEICKRGLEPCGHACENLCCEPCGPCNKLIEKVKLPCMHEAEWVKCSEYVTGPIYFHLVPNSLSRSEVKWTARFWSTSCRVFLYQIEFYSKEIQTKHCVQNE